MKYIFTFIALLLSLLLIGTVRNMYKYGYNIEDGFFRTALEIDEGTIWAPGFSEKNFLKIKIEMSHKDVLSILGNPLNPDEECSEGCFWLYTMQDSGRSDFDQRWIVFDQNKRVEEIRKSFFID